MDYLILGLAVMMWSKTAEPGGLRDEPRNRSVEVAGNKLAKCSHRAGSGSSLYPAIPFCKSVDGSGKDSGSNA